METLVQEGLLTKSLGEADRRTIRIALSPAGETRYQQLNETLDAHAERVMARIPPAEREQVAHALALLHQASHLVRRNIDECLDHAPCRITRLAGDCSLVGDG